MKKTLLISSAIILITIITLSQSSNASATLPPNGCAGSPMDNSGQTCTSCHVGTATQTTGVISSDIPASGFIGGTTYNFTVSMSGASAYGFELTPQTATSNTGLGTWIAGIGSSVSTKYIKQSAKKTGTVASWIFQWTAPTTATTVTFYGSFNYANNNSATSGDVIKKSSVTYLANTTGVRGNNMIDNIISVFPNPTTDELHIASTEDYIVAGNIYNIDGKLAKSVSPQELSLHSINVSELSQGLYYLHLFSKAHKKVVKFNKN